MTVATVTANGIETINIVTADMGADNNAATGDSGLVISTLTDDKLTNLNIISDTLVTITNDLGATLNTVDATEATAGVVLDFKTTADTGQTTFDERSLTINTGAGDDTLANIFKGITGTAAAVHTAVINTGDGKDTITIAGDVGNKLGSVDTLTIDAGAGNDTVDVSASTSIKTEATISVTLGDGVDTIIIDNAAVADIADIGITITDFVVGAGGDKINFNGAIAATNGTTFTLGSATAADNDIASATAMFISGTVVEEGAAATSAQIFDDTAGDYATNIADNQAIYVVYSDGTDSYLAIVTDNTGGDLANDTNNVNETAILVTFTGIENALDFTVDNFTDFLA